jgi:hypothetical protein
MTDEKYNENLLVVVVLEKYSSRHKMLTSDVFPFL